MKKNFWMAVLAGAVLILPGCGTVPETGRRQLNFISADQEMQLGLTSFEQLKKETPISKDAAANALVQKVGKRVAAVAELPNAQWEFVVFESPEANAFCLPGGKVGIYTGILPITRDEAGLATVIGHEVAHAVARHGAERMSEATAMEVGGQVLGVTLSKSSAQTQALAALAYGAGTQVGRALPHSRAQEAEADEIGLIYMARAGYNPTAALDFWGRFAQATASSDSGPWFLRTHPVTTDRIEHLRTLMPRAQAEFQRVGK